MIVYSPFWDTLRRKGKSTYYLIHECKISSSTIDRLRKNLPLTTTTLNDLCRILNCELSDIAAYVPSKTDQRL